MRTVQKYLDRGWTVERAKLRATVTMAELVRRDGECTCWDYEDEAVPCECEAWATDGETAARAKLRAMGTERMNAKLRAWSTERETGSNNQ